MRRLLLFSLALAPLSCEPRNPEPLDVYGVAGGCYTLLGDPGALTAGPAGVSWSDGGATPFRMQASGLGTYLLYDPEAGYVVGESGEVRRETSLRSDVTEVDDDYISGAEWVLETSRRDPTRYQLKSLRSGEWLGEEGLVESWRRATAVTLAPTEGCAEYPEIGLHAEGTPARTHFDDGDLYGIVDAHSHLFTNFGFGGGGIFHGSVFHPLGVEHALSDCEANHGEMGRRDFFGFAYDGGGNDAGGITSFLPDLALGELSEDNHATDGWPTFSEWPNARRRSTHQVQYYRWIERAYLAGLRLVVQHATSNAVICKITVGEEFAPARYDCEDMTAVDRQLEATYALERYIDAQHGGPGQGWLRIVRSPAEAREVIGAGPLAVVLGIETSDLFQCPLTPREEGPVCDQAWVDAQLDRYHTAGVRVMFPVHKYDNRFSPGDGSGDFIEIGNFLNTGHYTNMTQDCPADVTGLDGGPISFGGLLEPREDYFAPAPEDFSELQDDPILTMIPYVGLLDDGAIEGDWCQNAGLTALGEHLLERMMHRGMVVELDHFPKWSYKRAFEMLEAAGYPAVGTHGNDYGGRLYDLGGLSFRGFGRCHDPAQPGQSWQSYNSRLAEVTRRGGYPALGLAFDFNGFAGSRGPRFGPDGCGPEQVNPVSYPFTSWDGDITFSQPTAGERTFDFNTEGMIHLGLLPEYIEDARIDAVSESDLEPLFRSAEAYIRMWELAEERGEVLRGE
jgi:microsomal dipeptidase-like Zn-dependent dipeptidase